VFLSQGASPTVVGHSPLAMAVLYRALLGLCLAISATSTTPSQAREGRCSTGSVGLAKGLVLLQAPKAHTVHSRSGRTRSKSGDTHGVSIGDCANTNGAAGFNFIEEDGTESVFSCEDYEPPYDTYCGEADDDFNSSAMCCACGGGGKKPAPYGLEREGRVRACRNKKVGQKCSVRVNHPSELLSRNDSTGFELHSWDMTYLKSQCGLEVTDDGNEVLACVRTDQLPSCIGEEDGSLCGKHFKNRLMSHDRRRKRAGKGIQDLFLLCSCSAGSCPHCRWGSVLSLAP